MTTITDVGLEAMLESDAVSVGEQHLDVADLLLLGVLTGIWGPFEQAALRGLDLEAEQPGAISREELRAQATRFRYQHGLLSAADFTAWLRERSLSVAQLSGVLARTLLRERLTHSLPPRADQEELRGVLRAEALCGGVLKALADAALERLVAAHRRGGSGEIEIDELDARIDPALADALSREASGLARRDEQELRDRLRRLCALEDALSALRRDVADTDALRRQLADHGLDWLRLSGEQLSLDSEGAAREARLLLTDDKLSVSEVVARAGARVRTRSLYLDEAPPSMTGTFAAAAPGEPVGPWPEDDHWHLLLVRDKVRPSLDDSTLRERAVEELVTEVLARHAAGRTGRHCVL